MLLVQSFSIQTTEISKAIISANQSKPNDSLLQTKNYLL